jgi:hypothetical protein
MFIPDPGDPKGLDVNKLSLRDGVILKNPMRNPTMLQHYGNTCTAYDYRQNGWYDYCQNLHGGVDIGTNDYADIEVHAGVYGRINDILSGERS